MNESPPEPEELVPLVKPELQPGERLLWASRALAGSPSTIAMPTTGLWIWFLGIASVGVGCFAVLPRSADRPSQSPDILIGIIGVLSVIAAILMAVGFVSNLVGQWSDRWKVAGQSYALTDRRAMIWVPQARGAVSVHTFQRGTIKGQDLHRIQYPDGSGDVLFRSASFQTPLGFLGIAEVSRVEELVRRFLVDPNGKADPVATESTD